LLRILNKNFRHFHYFYHMTNKTSFPSNDNQSPAGGRHASPARRVSEGHKKVAQAGINALPTRLKISFSAYVHENTTLETAESA
jgi:hypothetical protein